MSRQICKASVCLHHRRRLMPTVLGVPIHGFRQSWHAGLRPIAATPPCFRLPSSIRGSSRQHHPFSQNPPQLIAPHTTPFLQITANQHHSNVNSTGLPFGRLPEFCLTTSSFGSSLGKAIPIFDLAGSTHRTLRVQIILGIVSFSCPPQFPTSPIAAASTASTYFSHHLMLSCPPS